MNHNLKHVKGSCIFHFEFCCWSINNESYIRQHDLYNQQPPSCCTYSGTALAVGGPYFFYFLVLVMNLILAQDISLFNQLNGHLDYIAIGNTLNTVENNSSFNCTINTTSAATLNLSGSQTIEAAYLYWAGSGDGDFDVILNSTSITPDRTFEYIYDESRQFFAAFTDVTEQVQNEGNGVYTLSDLENIDISDPYCSTGTNFAGWAIIIIYSNPSLPLNQINIYDIPSYISLNHL